MISEPELEGEIGPPDGPDTLAEDDPAPKRPRREVPRWAWAVGGALLASALWAGGLYVAGLDGGVDSRGYKVGKGLCAEVELSALGGELGTKAEEPVEMASEHSALDRGECSFLLVPDGQQAGDDFTLNYEVQTLVELHKKTDPGPEFEATVTEARWPGSPPAGAKEAVPELGEKAYFVMDDGTDDGMQALRLKVLDGGAVLTLDVGVSMTYTGDEETTDKEPTVSLDPSSVRPLMVKDARDLLAALKR
ncbi:hypothetical protein ABCR94_11205 [Streptomyces sp. 21So2-11]|uniref:hypothetical protein n=1 Tax=Streptomyces sp. 21So2-11 TaxID=3144408 RepID=UPI00321AA118